MKVNRIMILVFGILFLIASCFFVYVKFISSKIKSPKITFEEISNAPVMNVNTDTGIIGIVSERILANIDSFCVVENKSESVFMNIQSDNRLLVRIGNNHGINVQDYFEENLDSLFLDSINCKEIKPYKKQLKRFIKESQK